MVAFEPTPVCFSHLTEKFQDDDRLILEQMAIGEEEGLLHMRIADDPLAGTHQISEIAPSSDNSVLLLTSICGYPNNGIPLAPQ